MSSQPIYKRILLKLSGEALQGSENFGYDFNVLNTFVSEIKQASELGVQIGIVVGGGNLFRGAQLEQMNINRIAGDHMGMLATVMNGICLREAFQQLNCKATLMSSFEAGGITEKYLWNHAINCLENNHIVIFCGGTGNPLFTTDSAALLRGIETKCDIVFKATNVDGVYNSDPRKNPQAKLFSNISYNEVIKKELKVMDLAAFTLARDHKIPIKVFNIHQKGNLIKALTDINFGTLIK